MAVVFAVAAAPSFTGPLSVPGIQMWYDGSDDGNMSLSGTTVLSINDKSGNNRTGTQSFGSVARQTNQQNSLSTLYFSGVDLDVANPLAFPSSAWTVFVMMAVTSAGRLELFGSSTGGKTYTATLERYSDNYWYLSANKAGSQYIVGSSSTWTDGNYHQICGIWDGANFQLWIDNVSISLGTPGGTTVYDGTLDKFGYADGTRSSLCWIGDVMLYNQVVSSTDRVNMYNWMKAKWATP